MEVVERLQGIMDGFDSFFGSTSKEETDEARKKALAHIVGSKENGGTARGRDMITAKLIDTIVPKMRDTKPVSSSDLTDLLLGVLQTHPAEVEKVMKNKILKDRLEGIVNDTADKVRLRPAKKSEEWGSLDLVYRRSFDEWEVTLGYFPDYIRHRAIYGGTWTSPLINKSVAVSARFHRTEHYMVPKNGTVSRPGLVGFLKSAEVDKLAKAYSISYEIPPMGAVPRASTHTAKGGYKVMLETLEKEIRNSPYSAEKLLKELNSVTIFHEDAGISFHVIAEFPKGHPDIGQNLALVFGADFFNLTKQQWDEFKKMPPIAMAALEPLKD